jgi:hypothetical protein
MKDSDRFRLLGTYRTPRFRYGRTVGCAVRGEVEVVGLHEAPIPWPVGKRGRAKALVVFRGLARAVRRESEVAVSPPGPGTPWPGSRCARRNTTSAPWSSSRTAWSGW